MLSLSRSLLSESEQFTGETPKDLDNPSPGALTGGN